MTLTKKDKQGLGLIAGTAAVLLGLFAVNREIQSRERPDTDGCLQRVTRNTVIVLDRSDSTPVQTRREIQKRAMDWIKDSTLEGERVSVFGVDAATHTSLAPVFARCRPKSRGNQLYQNDRRIRREFDSLFVAPLSAILNSPDGTSGRSPIAQALIDLSLSAPMRSDTVALLVFSDLFENDPPRYTLYSCTDPASTVTAFRRGRTGMQERPSFKNLRARLNVIPRAGMSRTAVRCRDALWLWFFGDNAGESASLDVLYLPGGATP